jgi:hypothetical protein
MEGVEEVILLGAGNELTEGFFTVGGEGEALDEADFVFALLRGCQGERRGRRRSKGERFHGRETWLERMMRRASRLKASFYCKGSVN